MTDVAKMATDGSLKKRHRRRTMPRHPLQREKFTELRLSADYASDAALWRAVTGRDERHKINKILKEGRGISSKEMYDMARLLKVSQIELMMILGIEKEGELPNPLTISGIILEGGNIVSVAQNSAMTNEISYPHSAHLYGGSLLKVGDDSMGERYHRYDLVGFGNHTTAFASFIGIAIVAHLRNGNEVLRVLHYGGSLDTYALVAVVQDKRFPPIITNEIEWIAPIEAIYPALPG